MRSRGQKGAALIEMAFSLLTFIVVLVFTFEFLRVAVLLSTVKAAATLTARVSASPLPGQPLHGVKRLNEHDIPRRSSPYPYLQHWRIASGSTVPVGLRDLLAISLGLGELKTRLPNKMRPIHTTSPSDWVGNFPNPAASPSFTGFYVLPLHHKVATDGVTRLEPLGPGQSLAVADAREPVEYMACVSYSILLMFPVSPRWLCANASFPRS